VVPPGCGFWTAFEHTPFEQTSPVAHGSLVSLQDWPKVRGLLHTPVAQAPGVAQTQKSPSAQAASP
jgi:hypothetical protein